MSTKQMAEKYGATPEAARHWMIKYGIPRRNHYEATIKYARKPFSGEGHELSYLLGLRAGDIRAEKGDQHNRHKRNNDMPSDD